jgi:hypothetical protein
MSRSYRPIDVSELWEKYSLNPLTGELYYLQPTKGRIAGTAAGGRRLDGYVTVGTGRFLRHRLVYAWVAGVDPAEHYVDHVNCVPGDDRPWNLRLATPGQSSRNTRSVWVERRRGKFQARICVDYRRKTIGTFDTYEEAAAAYAKAAQELHGEFACTVGVGLPLAASTVNL